MTHRNSEAVVQRCFAKKLFLEILQNSLETNCARVSLLIKLQAWRCSMETMAQVVYCELYEISKNTFSYGTPPVAASGDSIKVFTVIIWGSTSFFYHFLNLHWTWKTFLDLKICCINVHKGLEFHIFDLVHRKASNSIKSFPNSFSSFCSVPSWLNF